MLLERCDTITKESAEAQAALQSEVGTWSGCSVPASCTDPLCFIQITKLKEEVAAQAIKANELATSNEHLKNVTDEQCYPVATLF